MKPVRLLKISALVGVPLFAYLDAAVPPYGMAFGFIWVFVVIPARAAHAILRAGLGVATVAALVGIAVHFSPRWEDVRWKLAAIGAIAAIFLADLALLGAGRARAASLLGLPALVAFAYLFCRHPGRLSGRTVVNGIALQVLLAGAIIFVPGPKAAFDAVAGGFIQLQAFTVEAMKAVFGRLGDASASGFILALQALPVIILVGALSRLLYHYGLLQAAVGAMAWVMRRVMGASGAESLASAANVFVGMVESPLLVRPYVAGLTESELFCVMTAGLATVAGSVMAVYMGFVGQELARHLLIASIISAPAAVVVAKLMIPETEEPRTAGGAEIPEAPEAERPVNGVDAVARGAAEGTSLTIQVAGMLIAFLALIAMANAILGWVSTTFGGPAVSLQDVFGRVFWPVAVLLGVETGEAAQVGSLLGIKTAANEFLAYLSLKGMLSPGGAGLSEHSRVVAIYALCGFANFGSVGIMIGGIGGMAPSRRSDVARLGLLSMVSGSVAAFMTACIAGFMVG